MSDRKSVVWFGDDPQPNTFFFRSPFRSWQFVVNTVLVVGVSVGCGIVVWKSSGYTSTTGIFILLLLTVIYPYWWALIRHGKINELYRSGKITEQLGASSVNTLLEVAENSMNEGLRNTTVTFGLFILAVFLWKTHHL
jgi:hypothetical protein